MIDPPEGTRLRLRASQLPALQKLVLINADCVVDPAGLAPGMVLNHNGYSEGDSDTYSDSDGDSDGDSSGWDVS